MYFHIEDQNNHNDLEPFGLTLIWDKTLLMLSNWKLS